MSHAVDPGIVSDVRELTTSQAGVGNAALYSPRLIAAIADRFPPERVIALIEGLADAEAVTKSGKIVVDARTRLAACTLLLNYLIGRPVERSESISIHVDADAESGLTERLAKSPALRQSLQRAIDKAEGAVEI